VLGGATLAIVTTTVLAIVVVGVAPFTAYAKLVTTGSATLDGSPYAWGLLNVLTRLLTSNP